jgi:hypothetical protein
VVAASSRTKLKQMEVDCEFKTLSEEKQQLEKEEQELRVLKIVSPHCYRGTFRCPPPSPCAPPEACLQQQQQPLNGR